MALISVDAAVADAGPTVLAEGDESWAKKPHWLLLRRLSVMTAR